MNKLEVRRLITNLYQSGIVLSIVDGRLRSEASVGAITDEVKELIVNNKNDIIAYISAHAEDIKNTKLELVREEGNNTEFPLTPTQKQFFFIDALNQGSAHYNLVGALQITGRFNPDLADQAFKYVIARHEPLQTSFHSQDQSFVQRIVTTDWNLSVHDLQHLDKSTQQEEIERLRQREVEFSFDLQSAPLFRVSYFKQSTRQGVLLCNLHHIAGDGWSIKILLGEFLQAYSALFEGTTPDFSPLPVRYSDYVQFLMKQTEQESYQKQLSYWQEQLNDLPKVHNFPLDHPRTNQQQFDGAVVTYEVPAELSGKLQSLANNQACTLFILLHGIFSCLLHKYSGNQDIVVGTPFSGREHEELQGLIGLFINTLVLRTCCSREQVFESFLQHVKSVNLQAQSNSQVTFSDLVESLDVNRDSGFPPLFQILFSMDNSQQAELKCPAFSLDLLPENKVKTKAEITLNATPDDDGIILRCEYNTGLFERQTMERLVSQFVFLASQVVENPRVKIADLSLLKSREKAELIADMAGPTLGYDKQKLVHQLIAETVSTFPQRTALKFDKNSITYTELNEQAEKLARHLKSTGGQSGEAVGVLIERSIDMVVAMLGILKAGMHYVPIDPAYPLNRINYVLAHAGVSAVVVSKHTAAIVSSDNLFSACVMGEFSADATGRTSNIQFSEQVVNSDFPAYMIYTSGSTGKPKGVVVSHRNVINFFTALDDKFGVPDSPHLWLAVTSISFDISVLEILWNLARGNEIVLMSDRPSAVSDELSSNQLDFSLFYFAAEEAKAAAAKYDLLLGGAKFADDNDLDAVWIPERHFSSFGDQFPNPSVAAAAVAVTTQRIKVRSGSVVLPLHDVIRVAEEWSMVDNLSAGRVEMSMASGWHPNDFVLMPEDYQNRHAKMNRQIEELHALWQGESIQRVNGVGKEVDIKVHPTPVQEQLTTWITAAGAPQTFEYAGKSGANVLTHLLGQTPQTLADKIKVYRDARKEAGLDPDAGKVALMLHTFVGEDAEQVREIVEQPFKQYLEHSINLLAPMAKEAGLDLENDRDTIIEMGYQRFYHSSGLFGSLEQCMGLLKEVQRAGVNEIACLIDFGIDTEVVLQHLPHICQLKSYFAQYRAQQDFLRKNLREHWSPQAEILVNNITHLQCTPSFLTGWEKDQVGKKALAQLEVLCVGGEAMPTDMPAKVLPALGGSLFNMYGPTETTVWSGIRQVSDQDINIGNVIGNTQFYVVDESDNLVPQGVVGELVIGGDGVTKGYHCRPELTGERFANFCFVDGETAHAYRTGDYVRYLGHQSFQFIGRKDEQVKINGFRIELGEVESFFNSLNAIDKAIAVAFKDTDESASLAVYARANNKVAHGVLDEAALRREAHASLPAYMVPSAIIALTEFPLTPNGKIDKKALPKLNSSGAQKFVPPETSTEKALADIWQEILSLTQAVSLQDDFFQLGGHSLLAITLQSKIKKQFGMRLGMEVLFTHSRLQDMAAQLTESTTQRGLPPIVPNETPDSVQIALNQQGLWLAEKINSASSLYNIVSMVHIEGEVESERLLRTLQLVEYKHDALRMCFAESGSGILIRDHNIGLKELPQAKISHLSANEQSQYLSDLGLEMSQHQFDMTLGPLWMVTLIKRAEEHFTLMLNVHHICIDGWSKRLWLSDIQDIYTSLESDPNISIEMKKGAQYRDFAHWQRQLITDGHFDYQLEYWLKKLAGISGFNHLPVDREYPEKQTFAGAKHEFVLDGETFNNIRSAASEYRVSLYMLMVTAYNLLLQMETEETDIVIGTDVSGRIHEDVEDIIGFFTNQIVLRNKIVTNASLAENIQDIKQNIIEAFAHQDVPFDLLVRKLALPRNLKYSPLFQAKIFMDHAPDYQRPASGWNMFVQEIENQPARCELTLGLIEYPDQLKAMFIFNKSLFSPSSVSRFASRFSHIAKALCTDASVTVQSLRNTIVEQETSSLRESKLALLNKRVKGIKRRGGRNSISAEQA